MGSTPQTAPTRYLLRSLPLSARLVLTVFLLCVGLGYLAALVQLHFQHAAKGELFPDRDQTYKIFHDERGRNAQAPPRTVGKLETLIAADPNEPFGATGQM